ncbi:YcxB family protein [Photobacterium alginatilyticum]|uniref:YcxB family protein n=1 Tax=Photobacterium alginatilyticum TaxID=1775171 RepID=UPI0040685B88
MEVEYTITENEYVKANKLYTKPTKAILIFYAIASIFLIVVALMSDSFIVRLSVAGGMVGGFIGQAVVRHFYAPWVTRKQYRSYQAAQEPVTLQMQADSLHFKSKLGESTIEWKRINKWRENSEFLLIYQAPNVYHILPKRISSEIVKIREALVEYVGKAT